MNLNKDQNRRDEILAPFFTSGYGGGCRWYNDLDLKTMEILVKEGFVDLEERQNYSPSIKEFITFVKKFPAVKFHGYVVSAERSDYRLSVEGLEVSEIAYHNYPDFHLAWQEIGGGADENESVANMNMRLWWD